MILLDTNVLIEFFKRRNPVHAYLNQLPISQLAICDVTQAEIIYGALNKSELGSLLIGMADLVSLPITPDISSSMLQLMRQYCLSHRLSMPDALITATALYHNLPLYTLNHKDFRYIPNLTLHEPI